METPLSLTMIPKTINAAQTHNIRALRNQLRGRQGHQYQKLGLSCRTTKPGVFKVRRNDDQPFPPMATIFVQVAEPWSGRTVRGYLPKCAEHGFACRGEHETCSIKLVRTRVAEWSVLVHRESPDILRVTLYQRPDARNRGDDASPSPAYGAGFTVVVVE